MMNFRKRGRSIVDAGTYWNFETGEKVRMEQRGMLQGRPSQTFYKLPPLLLLAFTAAAAHICLYVLPTYLVPYYEAYTEKLVTAYVFLDYAAIGLLLAGILLAAVGDIFGLRLKVPAFNWSPAEAHLDGRANSQTKKEDSTEKTSAETEKE